MRSQFLTPAQVLDLFGYKDRHSLSRLAARGLVERINMGGDTPQGRRYRYRLKHLEAEIPSVNEEEAQVRELISKHGL